MDPQMDAIDIDHSNDRDFDSDLQTLKAELENLRHEKNEKDALIHTLEVKNAKLVKMMLLKNSTTNNNTNTNTNTTSCSNSTRTTATTTRVIEDSDSDADAGVPEHVICDDDRETDNSNFNGMQSSRRGDAVVAETKEDDNHRLEEQSANMPSSDQAEADADRAQIQVDTIYPGNGIEHPSPGDVVKMHYTIALAPQTQSTCTYDQTIIENSRERYGGTPFSFVMGTNQVIQGMELALLQMHKAEVGKVVIPSCLAYGEHGFADDIPAGSDLECQIELIDFYGYEDLTGRSGSVLQ